ncbi:fatty acid desaturase [Burkholderia sp. Ac-20379]|uniref:fatty acid desaturase n=1 Tax=Burkholderia sp. Ac-20379 TaxID=2703900 RepID=UPI0030DC1D4C
MRLRVNAASDAWRARLPWLAHQDAIGAAIMALALAVMLAGAWLYLRGAIAWYVALPLAAFASSLIHELEHDLIHTMYFRRQRLAWHLMMALCWLARPGTVSPWLRQRLHLHHHLHSGDESDLEEIAITNGERWGLRRLLMLADGILAIALRPRRMLRAYRRYRAARSAEPAGAAASWLADGPAYFPLGYLHYALWYAFLIGHAWLLAQAVISLPGAAFPDAWRPALHVVDLLVVTWVGPHVLRSFCLNFVSSSLHYFGDIDSRNVIEQTQVLNRWWLAPFQLFCCNFGSTHAIHHYVVRDPFYLRQLTARAAHAAMREAGVPFNDVGTFRRANRRGPPRAASLPRQA